jgi:hypothetical protein
MSGSPRAPPGQMTQFTPENSSVKSRCYVVYGGPLQKRKKHAVFQNKTSVWLTRTFYCLYKMSGSASPPYFRSKKVIKGDYDTTLCLLFGMSVRWERYVTVRS